MKNYRDAVRLSSKYPWNSPYDFAENSPILYSDINGKGKGLAPTNVEIALHQMNPLLVQAFKASINSSTGDLYNWSMGRGGYEGTIIGVIGEYLVNNNIRDDKGMGVLSHTWYGTEIYGETFSRTVRQIDVAKAVAYGSYQVLGITFEGSYQFGYSSFKGDDLTMKFSNKAGKVDGVLFKYEVKTFNPYRSEESLYNSFVSAIDEAIVNGAGKPGDGIIGVLATDKAAWLKVANSPKYGKLLEMQFGKLEKTGNVLLLFDGLWQTAKDRSREIKNAIKTMENGK